MTREDIIEMARKVWAAGEVYVGPSEKTLEEFAALVAAAENEACAKVCEERITNEPGMQREDYVNRQCAAAIRARGQK